MYKMDMYIKVVTGRTFFVLYAGQLDMCPWLRPLIAARRWSVIERRCDGGHDGEHDGGHICVTSTNAFIVHYTLAILLVCLLSERNAPTIMSKSSLPMSYNWIVRLLRRPLNLVIPFCATIVVMVWEEFWIIFSIVVVILNIPLSMVVLWIFCIVLVLLCSTVDGRPKNHLYRVDFLVFHRR